MFLLRTCIIIVLLQLAGAAYCQDSAASVEVQPKLWYVAEDKTLFTSEQVARKWQMGQFHKLSSASVNFGRTDQRYWFHFTLPSETPPGVVLELSNAFLYKVVLYKFEGSAVHLLYRTGIDFPFEQRPVAYRHFALPLHNNAKGGEYYLMLDRRKELLRSSFHFYTPAAFQIHQVNDALFFGLIFGVLLFIAAFSCMLWLTLKDRIYLLYLGYILAMLLFIAADNGYGYQWLWPHTPPVQKYIRNFLSLVAVAIQLQFMLSFLGLSKTNSRYYSFIQKITGVALCLLPLMAFGSWLDARDIFIPSPFIYLTQVLFYGSFLAAAFLIVASSVEAVTRRRRMGYIYLLAMLPIVIQVLVVALSRWHVITIDIDTAFLFAIAILLEICTFGIGMIFRFNMIRKERLALSQMLMHQQQATMKKVLEAQEEERSRIAQDLHDQMGGTLSAVRGILSSLPLTGLGTDTRVHKAQIILENACNDLRTIAHNLMPLHLEHTTLAESLQESVAKANYSGKTRFHFITHGEPRLLHRDIQLGLIRIANELMQNVIRHSKATEATLQLLWHPEMTELMIEDNGQGFDPHLFIENRSGGIGLKSIFARADFINAEVRYDSTPHGTTVICTIPSGNMHTDR
jgi:two-component system, sensor histidine kinase LadS